MTKNSFVLLAVFQIITFPLAAMFNPAQAVPALNGQELNLLTAVCAGNTIINLPGHTTLKVTRNKVLIYNTQGFVPEFNDDLPDDIRAVDMQTTGIVVCLNEIVTVIDNCEISIFFSIPRVTLDYDINTYAVTGTGENRANTTVFGGLPPSCSESSLDTSVESIKGSEPASSDVLAFVNALNLNNSDDDGDGLSTTQEFIIGSDPEDISSPLPQLIIEVNRSEHLTIFEGGTLAIDLNLFPGDSLGQMADYYVYADTPWGLFSYIYPSGFKSVQSKEISVTAPIIQLLDFNLIDIPAVGEGEYVLHFEVDDGLLTFDDTSATISVLADPWQFTDVTQSAGFNYSHGYAISASGISLDRQIMVAGVAAGDYDNDGWVDLYVTRGTIGPNLLFRNRGDGTFEEVGAAAGVALTDKEGSGPVFADFDGDGWLDLFVGGINDTTQPTLLRNMQNGTFEDVTATSGIGLIINSFSGTFGDYDLDGDLDLYISHWTANTQEGAYLWQNNGDGSFIDVSASAGIPDELMADFSANFSDIDNDGWPDLLITADFGTSQVFHNNQDGTFSNITTDVISDENGMGSAIGDYDNDGDLDWFVSSIYDPNGPPGVIPGFPAGWNISGNRFYQNQGDGSFSDVTDETGVRFGYWGWGSCFADFNNDSYLDLFHVNGFSSIEMVTTQPFEEDASRLFISNKDGSFSERSIDLGLVDNDQGRGIVCFDYDRDGDVDIFIANNQQAPRLFRNDGGNNRNYLHIKVGGELKNSKAIGARIYVTVGGITQMRELRAGSNYMSQNPVEAYFGLGLAQVVDQVRVVWPSGEEITLEDVAVNQLIVIP